MSRRSRGKQGKTIARREDRESKYNDRRPDEQSFEFQPQILRKPENLKSEIVAKKEEFESAKKEVKVKEMTHSKPIISRNHLDTTSLLEFLDPGNSNFYVVGVVGMKNSGKSTLLNILATGEIHRCKVNGVKTITTPLFCDSKSGNQVEAFITPSRLILLDSAPVLNNTNCREFIITEADDLRQIQAMFRLCHELLIIYEDNQIMSLLRMLICAKNMLNPYECDEPEITLVENRTRPGSAGNPITKIAKRLLTQNTISDSVNTFELPDMNRSAPYYDDPIESINQLRDDINFRKELKAHEEPSETEKTWWEKFTKLRMEGGKLMQEYEAVRDKYYQPNETEVYA